MYQRHSFYYRISGTAEMVMVPGEYGGLLCWSVFRSS